MTIRRFITAGALSALLLIGTSFAASANFEECFQIDDNLHCYEIPVEYVKIKIPDGGDPPPEFDLTDILILLQDVLGDATTHWYMGDAMGQHTFLIDMETAQAFDLQTQGAAGP
jgi:hypothetical protein